MLHQQMDRNSKLHTGSMQCVFEVLNAFLLTEQLSLAALFHHAQQLHQQRKRANLKPVEMVEGAEQYKEPVCNFLLRYHGRPSRDVARGAYSGRK